MIKTDIIEIRIKGTEEAVWDTYKRIAKIAKVVGHMPSHRDLAGKYIMDVDILLPQKQEMLSNDINDIVDEL